MHASMQFLPVLPGPCAFFRASSISSNLLEKMASIVNSNSLKDGLIRGNLKIAEDRIPSFLVLVLPGPSGQQMETHWVKVRVFIPTFFSNLTPPPTPTHTSSPTPPLLSHPQSATFFFESEDTLKELVLQRRRWLNGTLSGYLWLVRNRLLVRGLLRCNMMAWKVFTLCSVQLLLFGLIYLMPALLLIGGHLSILGLFALLGMWGVATPSWSHTLALALLWTVYVGSFALLTLTARLYQEPQYIAWVSRD